MAAAAVVLAGMLLAIPPRSLPATQDIGEDFNALDGSWQLDLPARLARHQWAGRDFVFTYGPLYQLVHGLGVLVSPGDLASLMRWHGVLESVLVMACVWLLLAMTGASLAWRAPTYLLWGWLCPPYLASLSNYNIGLKPIAGLTIVAACGYFLGTTVGAASLRRRLGTMALWAMSAPLLFLYCFDLGILTLVAELLACVGIVAAVWRPWANVAPPALGRRALWAAGTALVGVALFGLLLSSGAWSDYPRRAWEIISGYAMTFAYPCTGRYLVVVAGADCVALLAVTVGALRLSKRTADGSPAAAGTAAALLAGGCFCLAWSRTGLSRSDWAHLWPLLAISVLMLGGLLACYLRSQRNLAAYPLTAAWVAPLLLLSPLGKPAKVLASLGQRLAAVGKLEWQGASLKVDGPTIRRAAAVARRVPQQALYVWPYEAVAGLIAGKENASYTVQSYTAHTDALQDVEIRHLDARPDLPVLLFTDSWDIDEVDNISRTSTLFQYLLTHYQADGRPEDGFLLLKRSRRAEDWETRDLSIPKCGFRPGRDEDLKIDLPSLPECRATDLFLLRIRVEKSFPWPWGKPGDLFATFSLSNGEKRVHRLLVPPDGLSHDILVSGCVPGKDFLRSAFDPRRVLCSRERALRVELRWVPMDRLSLQPPEIVLENVAILQRENVYEREASLAVIEQH